MDKFEELDFCTADGDGQASVFILVLTLESNCSLAVDEPGYICCVFDGQGVGGFVLDLLSPGKAKVYFKIHKANRDLCDGCHTGRVWWRRRDSWFHTFRYGLDYSFTCHDIHRNRGERVVVLPTLVLHGLSVDKL